MQTDVGMMVDTAPIESIPPRQVDTLVIPGGPGIWEMRKDGQLMKWISQVLPEARRVASVTSGHFALAWTGILDGKRCDALALLSAATGRLSKHHVEPNAIFVKTGGSGHRPASAPTSTSAGHDRGFRPHHRARRCATLTGGVLETARRPEPVLHRAGGASLRRRGPFQRATRLDHREHRKRSPGWRHSPRKPE